MFDKSPLFMQNKANFVHFSPEKGDFTKKQSQFKPNLSQNKPNSNPIKPKTNPIQSQTNPIQTQSRNNSRQVRPFDKLRTGRFNRAIFCIRDGGVFQSGGGRMGYASGGILRECAGVVQLRLLRGERGRGSIPWQRSSRKARLLVWQLWW